jgi:hypothetical protein
VGRVILLLVFPWLSSSCPPQYSSRHRRCTVDKYSVLLKYELAVIMGRSKHYVRPSNLKRSAKRLVYQSLTTINILKRGIEQTKDTPRIDLDHEEGRKEIRRDKSMSGKAIEPFSISESYEMKIQSSSLPSLSNQNYSQDNIGRSHQTSPIQGFSRSLYRGDYTSVFLYRA